MTPTPVASPPRLAASRAVWPLAIAGVAFVLFLVPGLIGPYGPFIDELYYVSCARRLAWGYVDHPPLSMALLRLGISTLGESLTTLRLLSAAIGAIVVAGSGLLARRLGAAPFGQALASLAVLTAPLLQVVFGFYSMNALELLLWLALCWVLVDIEQTGDERRWLIFGVLAGLALLNKHTVAVFFAGLGVAMILTPARRHLRSPWLWSAAGVGLALVASNLLWQQARGWPSLEFYRNAALLKNQPVSAPMVLVQQAMFMGLGVLPVTIAGVTWLLRKRPGADLRHLGGNPLHGRQPRRCAQGDLDDPHSPSHERTGEGDRGLGVVEHDDGDDGADGKDVPAARCVHRGTATSHGRCRPSTG